MPSGLRCQPLGRDEGAHGDDGADGEIDLPGDDHQRLADRDDADQRRRQDDLLEVGGLQEARLAQRHQRADDEEREDQARARGRASMRPSKPRELLGGGGRDCFGRPASCARASACAPAQRARRQAASPRGRTSRARDLGGDAAAAEDEDAIGHRHHLLGIVADQDDRDALRPRDARRCDGSPPWRRRRCRASAGRG